MAKLCNFTPYYRLPAQDGSGEVTSTYTQFYLIDSLGPRHFPAGFIRLMKEGGEFEESLSLGAVEAQDAVPASLLPKIRKRLPISYRAHEFNFSDGWNIRQQHDGSSCGYWAAFNSWMLVQTGSLSYLGQFSAKMDFDQPKADQLVRYYFHQLRIRLKSKPALAMQDPLPQSMPLATSNALPTLPQSKNKPVQLSFLEKHQRQIFLDKLSEIRAASETIEITQEARALLKS